MHTDLSDSQEHSSPTPPEGQGSAAEERHELRRDLLIFASRANSPTNPLPPELAEPEFDALAARVLAYQRRVLPPWRNLVETLGASLESWRTAPLVPTALFAEMDLCSLPPSPTDTVFETSGTTTKGARRGRRRVPDLGLYEAAMAGPFAQHVLGGQLEPRRWVSLIPDASLVPRSSLSHMVTGLSQALAREVYWVVDGGGLDLPAAIDALSEGPGLGDEPVIVLSTAFALAELLDRLQGRMRLPRGSRLMVTGGFKGKRKAIDPAEMGAQIRHKLGIPPECVVDEYGMTELSSQAYGRPLDPGPTLRFRILHPETGQDLPPGEVGLVGCFDLLNLDNVSSILTSDLGFLDPLGRLTLQGRLPGAVPRGCSLTAEELLSGARP